MTDYAPPWREESIGPSGFSEQPALYVLFVIGAIVVHAAVLSVGLLLRAAWEWVRPKHRGGSLHDSASK